MKRYILYRPLDRTGWGNRIRGLELCYLISLATNRDLVVDNPLVTEYYLSPQGTDWSFSHFKRELSGKETFKLELHLTPTNWNQSEWEAYGKCDLDELFPAPILELNEGASFADALVSNARYRDLWLSLGLDPTNKVQWVGVVTKRLLAHPQKALTDAVYSLKKKIGWEDCGREAVGVQYRTFFDIGSPLLESFPVFRHEVTNWLKTGVDSGPSGCRFFITTDSIEATKQMALDLAGRGSTHYREAATIHTGGNHLTWGLFISKVVKRLGLISNSESVDFWTLVPPSWRFRPQRKVLAEWFLLGECQTIFSTFTSFAVYASARTGNQAALVRFDPDEQKLETLTNAKYFF